MSITFFLNGQKYRLYYSSEHNENLTLEKILNYLNYKNKIFVVEYNNMICNQKNWSNQKIYNNDKLEVITIVGGG